MRSALALATPALCLELGLAQPAKAQILGGQIPGQVAGALGVQSNYLYRGISLSSGLPAATLDLSYDHPSGAYAGASAVGAVVDGQARSLGFIEYLGYATPRRGVVSWDVGLTNQDLAYYAQGRRWPVRYAEVYVGAAGEFLSAHLHYSPNYIRAGYGALYAEVDASTKPVDNWRLFAHLGSVIPVGDAAGRTPRYDARAGVGRQFGALELQASVTATTPDPPGFTPRHRTALVVGANWFF